MVKKNENLQQDDHHERFQQIKPEFNVFNRKKQRKEKKMIKKQKHMQFNQQRNWKNQGVQIVSQNQPQEKEKIQQQEIQNQQTPNQHKQQQQKQVKQKLNSNNKEIDEKRKLQLQREIEQEEKEIERLTKRLKLKQNRLPKAQIMEDGLEEDLFDFLDHIDKSIKEKVTPNNYFAFQKKNESDIQSKTKKIYFLFITSIFKTENRIHKQIFIRFFMGFFLNWFTQKLKGTCLLNFTLFIDQIMSLKKKVNIFQKKTRQKLYWTNQNQVNPTQIFYDFFKKYINNQYLISLELFGYPKKNVGEIQLYINLTKKPDENPIVQKSQTNSLAFLIFFDEVESKFFSNLLQIKM